MKRHALFSESLPPGRDQIHVCFLNYYPFAAERSDVPTLSGLAVETLLQQSLRIMN
jgi:hypothetical protein